MAILDTITHSDVAKRHRPWPRALVSEEGWRQAIDQLATGRLVLLGLWGDAPMVHMALFDESSGDAAVTSYSCKNDEYPSVGARHAPAIRNAAKEERASPVGRPVPDPNERHDAGDERQRACVVLERRRKSREESRDEK